MIKKLFFNLQTVTAHGWQQLMIVHYTDTQALHKSHGHTTAHTWPVGPHILTHGPHSILMYTHSTGTHPMNCTQSFRFLLFTLSGIISYHSKPYTIYLSIFYIYIYIYIFFFNYTLYLLDFYFLLYQLLQVIIPINNLMYIMITFFFFLTR